jgi:hypothetical protein
MADRRSLGAKRWRGVFLSIRTIFAGFQHFSPEIHRQGGSLALHLSTICVNE